MSTSASNESSYNDCRQTVMKGDGHQSGWSQGPSGTDRNLEHRWEYSMPRRYDDRQCSRDDDCRRGSDSSVERRSKEEDRRRGDEYRRSAGVERVLLPIDALQMTGEVLLMIEKAMVVHVVLLTTDL